MSPPLELEVGTCPMVRLAPHSGHLVCFPACRSSALNALPQAQILVSWVNLRGSIRRHAASQPKKLDYKRKRVMNGSIHYLFSQEQSKHPGELLQPKQENGLGNARHGTGAIGVEFPCGIEGGIISIHDDQVGTGGRREFRARGGVEVIVQGPIRGR